MTAGSYLETIQLHLDGVLQRIEKACREVGRDPASVELLAVTKQQPVSKIAALNTLGISLCGENYLQELEEKVSEPLLTGCHWVFIGQLQSNKIQRIVQVCDEIQTVSSAKHARYVARYAQSFNKSPFPIYLQVNLGEEAQKAGFKMAEVDDVYRALSELSHIRIKGLMSIPPRSMSLSAASGEVPEGYLQLVEQANRLGLAHVSLGMSQDFETAIKAGSTCVRLGTLLLGERMS